MFLFFFSSRRRHTTWPRDWSSDVCSSDLPFVLAERDEHHVGFVANPDWGGARGNVGKVEIAILPEEEQGAAWRRGEFDLLIASSQQGDWFDVDHEVDLMAPLATQYVAFFDETPPFDSALVRRSFAHAIDRTRIPAGS